jgi:hypothetical protein
MSCSCSGNLRKGGDSKSARALCNLAVVLVGRGFLISFLSLVTFFHPFHFQTSERDWHIGPTEEIDICVYIQRVV